jgi:hypothetical protein
MRLVIWMLRLEPVPFWITSLPWHSIFPRLPRLFSAVDCGAVQAVSS